MSIDRRPSYPAGPEAGRLYRGEVELFPEEAVVINRRLGLGFRPNYEGRNRDIVVVRERSLGLVIERSKGNPTVLEANPEDQGFIGKGIDVRGVERIVVGEGLFVLTLR